MQCRAVSAANKYLMSVGGGLHSIDKDGRGAGRGCGTPGFVLLWAWQVHYFLMVFGGGDGILLLGKEGVDGWELRGIYGHAGVLGLQEYYYLH